MPPRLRYCSSHCKLAGYEVCIHRCRCMKHRSTPLWSREGGACARHSTSRTIHPNCSEECPGFLAFDPGAQRSQRTRNPTREEILLYLPSVQAASELKRLGLESGSDAPQENPALYVSHFACNLNTTRLTSFHRPVSDDVFMEADEAELEQDKEGQDGDHDDHEHHPEDDMQIDPDPQGSVESREDPIPRVVAGPSGIRSSSYAASDASASNSTTSFGIRDTWRVTTSVARSSSGPSVHSNDAWYPAVPSEVRKFEILYVPDPSRAMKRKEADKNLGWAMRDLTTAQYESIKHLTELVYKNRATKNGVQVLVTEWVSINLPCLDNRELTQHHSCGFYCRWMCLRTARHSMFISCDGMTSERSFSTPPCT